jgi:hypothetical protein
VRRKLSLACLLCAWFCANGVVWNVVQVVGWAKMMHDYSEVMPVARAIEVTFSGEAPCHFCHISRAAEDTAQQQLPHDVLGGAAEKILFLSDCAPAPLVLAPAVTWPGVADATGRTRTEAVPVPPPRVA